MSERTPRDPDGLPAVGESRSQVLGILRAASGPVGVREIAERTGLHTNTVRFHLDTLVKEGFAERGTDGRGRPGRPRTVYHAASAAPAGRRSYRLLAQMLTGLVTQALPQPARAAAGAGEEWGRYLADTPPPDRRVGAEEAVRRLTQVLEDVGFSPGPVQDRPNQQDRPHQKDEQDQHERDQHEQDHHDEQDQKDRPYARDRALPLHHCPFREIAEEHQEVVCSLHLGLMRGVLEQVRAPLDVDRLEPFVEPSLCLAHLTGSRKRRPDPGV